MLTQKKNTEIRKKQIIDATRKLIIRHGSEQITVRKIAEEVGISEAAVYRHFKSKGDILDMLSRYTAANLAGDIPVTNEYNGSFLQAVDSTMRNHISAIEQRQGISFQIISEILSLGDKKLKKQFSKVINEYIQQISKLISQGIEAGEIKVDIKPDSAAIIVYGMIQGLVNIWALNNYSFNLIKEYDSLWNIFRSAIAK
jgi:AcrR family transcriptional regulator